MQFWVWLYLLSPTFTIPTELPTVLVTGSTDGIGKHTSLRLLQHGYRVFIHGRDQQKLDATVAELSQHGDVNGFCHDLSSVQGCTDLASDVKKNTPKLDVLINNAGVFSTSQTYTPTNLEMTFAVNVLAPFVLTRELLPILKKSSRVINVSSISQHDGPPTIDFDNLNYLKGGWDPHTSYGMSKRLMALYSKELSRRIDPLVVSCDPGTVKTKMLLAGWGEYGIDLKDANNEFTLATSTELTSEDDGKYYFGDLPHDDVNDVDKGRELWKILETLAGDQCI